MAIGLQPVIPATAAALIWARYVPRLRGWFRSAIWSMGTSGTPPKRTAYAAASPSRAQVGRFDGPAPSNDGVIGRPPSPRAIKLTVLDDIDLYLDYVTAVEHAFWQAVADRRLPPHSADAWLGVVTRRIAQRLTTPRVKELLLTVEPNAGGDPVAELADPGAAPDEYIATDEILQRLARAVSELAPSDQAVVAAWANGVSSKALGASTGRQAGAARVHVHRLIDRLRQTVLRHDPAGTRAPLCMQTSGNGGVAVY